MGVKGYKGVGKMIRLFEAFSGYGSQALALSMYDVDFKHVGISEINKSAIKAHRALHGCVCNYGDISKIDWSKVPDFDLLTYSFPCTDITKMGEGKGLSKNSGTRSALIWEVENPIEIKRPSFLMMENVIDLVNKNNMPDFIKWLELLESYGYNNYWKIIDARHCGIPQGRKRVFLVSILKNIDDGTFSFYDDGEMTTSMAPFLEEDVSDEKYLYNHTSEKSVILDYGDDFVKIKNGTKKGYLIGKPFDSLDYAIPTSTSRRGRLHDYCHTLMTNRYSGIYDGKNFRYLTERESFRLMGLEDDMIDKIQSCDLSMNEQYFIAGNSIVVQCMRFLKKLEAIDILNEDKPTCQLSLF